MEGGSLKLSKWWKRMLVAGVGYVDKADGMWLKETGSQWCLQKTYK